MNRRAIRPPVLYNTAMMETREAPHAGSRESPLVAGDSEMTESIAGRQVPHASSPLAACLRPRWPERSAGLGSEADNRRQ